MQINSKVMKTGLRFVLFLVIMGIPVLLQAQSPQVKQREKQEEKAKIEKKKALAKAEEEGRKRHIEMQTKEVQKRMKRNRKKSDLAVKGKRKNFFQRLFGRN